MISKFKLQSIVGCYLFLPPTSILADETLAWKSVFFCESVTGGENILHWALRNNNEKESGWQTSEIKDCVFTEYLNNVQTRAESHGQSLHREYCWLPLTGDKSVEAANFDLLMSTQLIWNYMKHNFISNLPFRAVAVPITDK